MVKLFMASGHNWLCKLRLNLDRKVPPCTGQKGINSNPPLGSPLPFRQHFRFLTKQQQRKNCDGNSSSF
jgi:hypothetical protein